MKDLHSDINAQKDGNIHNDANFMPNTKGKSNGSSELPKNVHDPATADQEPDKKKKRAEECVTLLSCYITQERCERARTKSTQTKTGRKNV